MFAIRCCVVDCCLERALVAVILLAAAASAATAQGDPWEAIPERMEQYVAEGQIAGAVTLVAHQGSVVHLAAVGMADLKQQRPMEVDTLFRIASMTKPIAATAVMILQDEGRLSVDDAVAKYIPAFANARHQGTDEPIRGLTIRHLLTHTSGLGGDQRCEESLEATAEMLAARLFDFQPGARWQYGPSMNVCGRIVEIVSGEPFDQFVRERIFRPLGMSDTTFSPSDGQIGRIAIVYRLDDEPRSLKPAQELIVGRLPAGAPSPSGGLFSTASDMFRFYQMILDGGVAGGQRIVSAEAIRAMTTVQTGGLETGFTPGNGWGLGWCVVRRPEGVTGMLSPGTFGHGGVFGTQGWVDPQRQAVFVLMIQRADLANSDASEVRREFQRLAVEALHAASPAAR